MKKYFLFVSTFLLLAAPALADSLYGGTYQLFDNKGKVLYTGLLELQIKDKADGSKQHIYIDYTAQGAVKTVCDVEVIKKAGQARDVSEDCGNSLSEMECIGDKCVGLAEFDDFRPGQQNVIRETNSASRRVQMIVSPEPTNYLGLKNVKSYVHTLNRLKK